MLDPVCISAVDRIDDLFVFGDGDVKIIDDRTCIQTPVPLRLWLDCLMQCEQPGARSGFDDRPMKIAVEIKNPHSTGWLGCHNCAQLLIEQPQLSGNLDSLDL